MTNAELKHTIIYVRKPAGLFFLLLSRPMSPPQSMERKILKIIEVIFNSYSVSIKITALKIIILYYIKDLVRSDINYNKKRNSFNGISLCVQ